MKLYLVVTAGLIFLINSILVLMPPYIEFNQFRLEGNWGRVLVQAESLEFSEEEMTGNIELRSTFWIDKTNNIDCDNYKIIYSLFGEDNADISLRLKLDSCSYYGEQACQKGVKNPVSEFLIHDIDTADLSALRLSVKIKNLNSV